jgi:ferredoxin
MPQFGQKQRAMLLQKVQEIDCARFQRVYAYRSKKIMADVANRYPENLPGKYYVDNQCIDCDLCRETAPSNFGRNDDGGYSYVFKQPTSPDEEKLCKEAMEGCPVEAIGDNGG